MSNTEIENLNTLCKTVQSEINSDLELELDFKCVVKYNQNSANLLLMFFNLGNLPKSDEDRIASWVIQKSQDAGFSSTARNENVKLSDSGLILFYVEGS